MGHQNPEKVYILKDYTKLSLPKKIDSMMP